MLIPVLPLVDEPIEHYVELFFEKAWPMSAADKAKAAAGDAHKKEH